MKFDSAIRGIYGKNLKRIRVKVDPLHASAENYKAVDGYEGYVLEENEASIKLMMIQPGSPVVDIPQAALAKPTMFDLFKCYVEDLLGVSPDSDSPVAPFNSKTFEELEERLSKDGFTNKEISNLYREFLKRYEDCQ